MKKQIMSLTAMSLALLCASGLAESVKIDSAHFPDERFRAVVQEKFDTDKDGALSDKEIKAADILYADSSKISSVQGIEHLTNLDTLDLMGNQVSEINPAANPKFTTLILDGNPIKTVDISGCPGLVKGVKNSIIYRDEGSVHWSNAELSVDSKTTVVNGDKLLYIPDMLPFLSINLFEAFFTDAEPSEYAADVTIKEAKTYSDPSLKQAVGTIPAYTAILIDASAVNTDSSEHWTVKDGAYSGTTSCKVLNYGDTPVYINPSALWGNVVISPNWTYTTLPKGTTLYQRPDLASASTELDKESAIAVISEKDGWLLIRVDRGDVDPYFFVPAK